MNVSAVRNVAVVLMVYTLGMQYKTSVGNVANQQAGLFYPFI